MRRLVMVMDTTLNGKVDDVIDRLDRPSDDLYAGIDRGLDDFDTVLIGPGHLRGDAGLLAGR